MVMKMGRETKTASGGEAEGTQGGLVLRCPADGPLHDGDPYPLAPEIEQMTDEIGLTAVGRGIIKSEEFSSYLWMNSDELSILKDSIEDDTFTEDNVTPALARSLFHNLPPLVSLEDCPEILELIAAGSIKEIGELVDDGDEVTRILKTRRLASILEELSVIKEGSAAGAYEIHALSLNSEVQACELPELKASPRKVHAVFSNIDIRFRRLQRNWREGRFEEAPSTQTRELQLEYYRELIDLIDQISTMNSGEAGSISGAVGELLVLGRVRDRLIKRGHFSAVEASQSFLRQDLTDNGSKRYVPNKYLKIRRAFDLSVMNHDTGSFARIEVKKRSEAPNERKRSRQQTLEQEKRKIKQQYLPNIDVVAFRLGRSTDDYCDLALEYCYGRLGVLSGKGLSSSQEEAFNNFAYQVDPQITSIFSKRKLLSH